MILNKIARIFRNETTGDEPGGAVRAVNPRIAAMAEIAQQANARTAGEMESFDEDAGTVTPNAAAPAQPDTVSHADDDAPEPEQAAAPVPEKPRMVAIVVDGQSIEVEESRIIEAGKRTLQKDHAADRRLQQAAEKDRQAQALLERAQRLHPEDPAPSQDAPQPAKPATQGLSPEALDTYLENKLYMRDAQKAAAKFREDFPDIASDPYLMDIAGNLEQQRLNTAAALGESFGDPFEAYRKHGEAVKQWLQQRAGTQAPAAPIDKQERKRTITAIPAVNARAPAPAAAKVPTTDEVIEAMRARRAAGGRPIQRTQ